MRPQNQAWEALTGKQTSLGASPTSSVGLLVRVGLRAGKLSFSWRLCTLGSSGDRQVAGILPLARTHSRRGCVSVLAPGTDKKKRGAS